MTFYDYSCVSETLLAWACVLLHGLCCLWFCHILSIVPGMLRLQQWTIVEWSCMILQDLLSSGLRRDAEVDISSVANGGRPRDTGLIVLNERRTLVGPMSQIDRRSVSQIDMMNQFSWVELHYISALSPAVVLTSVNNFDIFQLNSMKAKTVEPSDLSCRKVGIDASSIGN